MEKINTIEDARDLMIDETKEIRIPSSRTIMRQFMKAIGETLVHTCELLTERNPDHPYTVQNLNNKLTRDSIRFREVIEIADVHGYSVCFQKKGNNKIVVDNKKNKQEIPNDATRLDYVMSRMDEGFTSVQGINFESILLVGENYQLAENALTPLLQSKKIDRSAKGALAEIALCARIQGMFDVIAYPVQ